MVSWLAYPKPLVEKTKDVVLTFVVPSEHGCDLRCSYCFIKQRKELTSRGLVLSAEDYAEFIRGIAENRPIGCVSIQGEEPLLKESMPYTKSILSVSQEMDIPAALVTNGTRLADEVETLARFHNLEELTVSLDASEAKTHDDLRGVSGTFERVVSGLIESMQLEPLNRVVSVVSVLFPGCAERLQGIPALLQGLGIRRWFVTPAVRIGSSVPGGPVSDWKTLITDLQSLHHSALNAGIEMIVEDEYNAYGEVRQKVPPLMPLRFRNLEHPEGMLRLLPDGSCEAGYALLHCRSEDALRWEPGVQHPDDFYQKVIKC